MTGPLRKKKLFGNFFFILLNKKNKNKNYFTLDNLSKYENTICYNIFQKIRRYFFIKLSNHLKPGPNGLLWSISLYNKF